MLKRVATWMGYCGFVGAVVVGVAALGVIDERRKREQLKEEIVAEVLKHLNNGGACPPANE